MIKFCVWISAEAKPDLVSCTIMKYLGTNYSHIGIGLCDNEGHMHTIYDSVGEGFRTMTTKEFTKNGEKIIKGIKYVEVVNRDRALGWLDGNIGKDYSEMQYIGFIFPRFRKFVDNDSAKLICSEVVASFLKAHKVNGFDEIINADFASPKDVWEALQRE